MASYKNRANTLSEANAQQLLLNAINPTNIVDEQQRLSSVASTINQGNFFSAQELLDPEVSAFKTKYDEITKRGAVGDIVAGSVNVHDKVATSLADAVDWSIKQATGVDSITQGVYERQARKRLKQEEELQKVGEAAGVHPSLLYALPEIAASIAPAARLGVLKGATVPATIAKTASANSAAEFGVSKLLGSSNEDAMWNAIGAGAIMAPIGAASHLLSGSSKVDAPSEPSNLPVPIKPDESIAQPSSMFSGLGEKVSSYSNDFKQYVKGVDERMRTYSTKDHPVEGADDALDTEIMSDNKYKQRASDAYTKASDSVSEAFDTAKQFVSDTKASMDNFDIDGFVSHIKNSIDESVDGTKVSKPDFDRYATDIRNSFDELKESMNPTEFVSMAKGYMEQSLYRANNLDDFSFTRKLDDLKYEDSFTGRAIDGLKSSYNKLDSFVRDGIDNGTLTQSFKDVISKKLDDLFGNKKVSSNTKLLPESDEGFNADISSLGSKLGQESGLKRKIEIAKDEIKTFRAMNKEGKIEKITSHYFPDVTEANANQMAEFRQTLDDMYESKPEVFREMENAYIGEKEYKIAEHRAQLRGKYEGQQSGNAKEVNLTVLERRKLKRKAQEKKDATASAKQEAVYKAKSDAKKELPAGSNKIDHSAEDAAKAKHQKELQREVENIKKKEEHQKKEAEAKAERAKKEEEIKARKHKDADVDSSSYAISTKDIADVRSGEGNIGIDDMTKSLDEKTVGFLQSVSGKSFVAPKSFEFLSSSYAKWNGYFSPDSMTAHVKGVDNVGKHARMIATYMHESLHKAMRELGIKGDIDNAAKSFDDSDFTFTHNQKAYEVYDKSIRLEEELVHYASMRASIRYMKNNGIKPETVFSETAMKKLSEFDKAVKSSKELQNIASKMDYLLFHGSTRKGSFLNDFMYGKKDIDNNVANTMYGIDKKLSEKLPRLKSEIENSDNATFRNFTSSIDESDIGKEFNAISARKTKAENDAVIASTSIRQRIHDMIPSKTRRAEMTNHVLRTDYQAIAGVKTRAEAIKIIQDIDVRLSKSMSHEQYARLSEFTKHLARGMNGDLNALNSPMMLSNALAIAKRTGLKNIPDEMIKDIDKKITIQALEIANKKSSGATWQFIEANNGKKWFTESIGLIKYKNELSKEMFTSNKMNYNKGYSKESYASPYIYKQDEYGNAIKSLDNDLAYAEGAIPIQNLGTKGSKVFDIPEHMKDATESAKEAYALRKQLGVVLDANGNIGKFRQHLLSEEGKIEAGRVDDFADVMADTYGGIMKKKAIEYDFIPSIKESVESGSSKLMSSEPKAGFVEIDASISKLLPYELQGVIKYVKPEFKQLLLGNIEVGYSGKSDILKTSQALLKDTVSNFKENVVLKNPVSWANAFMFNISVGLQHGMPAKFMARNMQEGVKAYSQMRDVQRKLFMGVADGTLSKGEQGRLQAILDNNLLYQLNKEGMTLTIVSEITAHPSFSRRLADRLAFDRLKSFVGEDMAEKISDVWKNIYLHPHAATGQFAIDTLTKIDVMGRYSLAKYKMTKDGMTAAQAAQYANSVFGDFNKVLPVWVQYIQEFGAIPFAGWFFRVAGGLAKTAYDNPAKTLALTAGLYALQQSTGERTESWSPVMALATSPMGMVTMSPYANPEDAMQKSKVPEVYNKAYKSMESEDPSRMIMSPSF